MPYSRPYGSGGFKDSPDTSTPIIAAALNTMDIGIANAHTDIASTLATIPSRNRIVNGGMMVDQRRAGAATSATAYDYIADRFVYYSNTTANALLQRVTDGPAGASGHSARVTVSTTKASPATGDYAYVEQTIEGYNVADLGSGTASPQSITVSFYVKSSVAGTYGISLHNSGRSRSYVTTYTINAANTWERKTITLTADASGTWLVDNGMGLNVVWHLMTGSTYRTATTNAWQAGTFLSTASATNLFATASATWQLSGVQVEYGTAATRFEHRSFMEELARCQRYYYRVTSHYLGLTANGYDLYNGALKLPVTMRAAPTLETGATYTLTSGNNGTVAIGPTAGVVATVDQVPLYNSANNWSAPVYARMTAGFTAEL